MNRPTLCILLLLSMLTLQAKNYDITAYGAKSDTTILSTAALQQCIDLCSQAGGGCVVVPAGNYKIGTVILKSNVHLHLELGATLYGSTDLKDYQRMKSDYLSLRTHTETVQLIYADSAENIVIDGYGTIDGRGSVFPKLSWNDEGITRPHLLRFIQSRNITIKDITLKNSGCWMQHYLACDRLRIDGIKVTNRNNYNNDALDLDGCHDVVISNMIADSDDDGITLKSTSPRLCEDITIENCIVSSHCNAVKLGTETNGGFRNITIHGIVVKPSADQSSQFFGRPIGSSALSLEIVDGGVMENVNISDFTVTGTESPIFVRLGHRGRGWMPNQKIEKTGSIHDVNISHIYVRNAGRYGCSITGLPGHPVENIRVKDISIHHQGGINADSLISIHKAIQDEKVAEYPEATMWGPLPAKGFYVHHARGVILENITIDTVLPDERPLIVREDDM